MSEDEKLHSKRVKMKTTLEMSVVPTAYVVLKEYVHWKEGLRVYYRP